MLPKCQNSECGKEFEPKRKDQKYCYDQCRKRSNHLNRHRDIDEKIKIQCEGCRLKMTLSKRQIRYLRKNYNDVLCEGCKLERINTNTESAPITDPYEDGLFVAGCVSPDPALVCPLG